MTQEPRNGLHYFEADPNDEYIGRDGHDIFVAKPATNATQYYEFYKTLFAARARGWDALYDQYMKLFSFNPFMAPFTAQMGSWNTQIQGAISDKSLHDRLIADVMKATGTWMYQALTTMDPGVMLGRPVNKNTLYEGATVRDRIGNATRRIEYNDRLYTHNLKYDANGNPTLNKVSSGEITPFFAPGQEKDWPQLVLTANHAIADGSKDVSDLMDGIEAMCDDSFGGRQLSLIRKPVEEGFLDESLKRTGKKRASEDANGGKRAIFVGALGCRETVFNNGAQLIYRVNELERFNHYVDQKRTSRDQYIPDPSEGTSRAARRLAKLVLKLMVEPELQPYVRLGERDTVAQDGKATDPLVLRADAAEIARHIKMLGYSKGGNAVSDAARFLVKELMAKRDGRGFVQVHGADGKLHDITRHDVANIMRNIAIVGMAAGELPLSQQELDFGIRRTLVYSNQDLLAGHFLHDMHGKLGRGDDIFVVDGLKNGMGHDPEEAMGCYRGTSRLAQKGYLLNPEQIANGQANPEHLAFRDRFHVMMASAYGIVAISNANIVDGELRLTFGPGASPDMIEQVSTRLHKALSKHLGVAESQIHDPTPQNLLMRIPLPTGAAQKPETWGKLENALKDVIQSEPGHQTGQEKSLYVSEVLMARVKLRKEGRDHDASGHPADAMHFADGRAPDSAGPPYDHAATDAAIQAGCGAPQKDIALEGAQYKDVVALQPDLASPSLH